MTFPDDLSPISPPIHLAFGTFRARLNALIHGFLSHPPSWCSVNFPLRYGLVIVTYHHPPFTSHNSVISLPITFILGSLSSHFMLLTVAQTPAHLRLGITRISHQEIAQSLSPIIIHCSPAMVGNFYHLSSLMCIIGCIHKNWQLHWQIWLLLYVLLYM